MTTVEPIRNVEDIRKLEKFLEKRKGKRDLLFFTMGINWGLRISDIVALNVGDVKGKTYVESGFRGRGVPFDKLCGRL